MWGNENEKINQLIHEHDKISDQLEKYTNQNVKGLLSGQGSNGSKKERKTRNISCP